jgi:DUF1365 family protein
MVTPAAPALYVGRLRHRRFTPTPHAFTYSLFMALLDVDAIDAAMRVSRLTSRNRFNWASFDDRDHTGDPAQPLRARLQASAAAAGVTLPDGPIHLLTHLRYLGFNFNPISFYYGYDRAGALAVVCAEVHNTFGGERLYWLPLTTARRTGQGWHVHAPKRLHVSPFMPMEVDYEFVLTPPADSLVAHMTTTHQADAGAAPFFDATLTLERRPWTASALHGVLARHPWMTAKVIGAIHWEALRLWWKGLRVYDDPERMPAAGGPSRQEAEV